MTWFVDHTQQLLNPTENLPITLLRDLDHSTGTLWIFTIGHPLKGILEMT